ncbi:MAG: hypothetical protein GY700_15640, partial [Propionibacteriaceae bacterium]|nr:hypothetical protein [Propionibacteriaceae bacterium]
ALEPWTLLQGFLGETGTTANGEVYTITESLIAQTRSYAVANPCDGVKTSVFADRGDEVIDYRIAEALYRNCARLAIFEGVAVQPPDRL